MRSRKIAIVSALLLGASLMPLAGVGQAAAPSADATRIRQYVRDHLHQLKWYSQGVRNWVKPPVAVTSAAEPAATQGPSFGSNVDANDPTFDLAGGQSETAIAAFGNSVVVSWNDATAFLAGANPLSPLASSTGVAYSKDGGATFSDLVGLPNDNPNQIWASDPTVVAVDATHFIVASLYFPSFVANCKTGPMSATVALTVGTVSGGTLTFGDPIVPVQAGNLCARRFGSNTGLIDKEFLAFDPTTRTLALSYSRDFFSGHHSGLGQIEVARATVPADATALASSDFAAPIVVWKEEQYCRFPVLSSESTQCGAVVIGAYPAVASNGDVYVAWERNIFTELFNGDPYTYEHVALIPAGATEPSIGGRDHPFVFTLGQANGNADGGVKTLNAQVIAGYNRGLGNDMPRIAIDNADGRVVFCWNDASLHPLGDIFIRTASFGLGSMTPIRQVNDDNSFALHFLPALSIGSDGSIRTSWYDRRLGGADSAETDYFGEVRTSERVNAPDFRISTGSTDWTNTSSLIVPNFGDYTDNTTTGTKTYYTWSDGRIGVPQPFVDSR